MGKEREGEKSSKEAAQIKLNKLNSGWKSTYPKNQWVLDTELKTGRVKKKVGLGPNFIDSPDTRRKWKGNGNLDGMGHRLGRKQG